MAVQKSQRSKSKKTIRNNFSKIKINFSKIKINNTITQKTKIANMVKSVV